MPTIQLAAHAMATRFELVLAGESEVALRAAGEEALEEIKRLEDQLSLFRPGSEIAHLNARAWREPVRVTPPLFALLQHAQKLTRETEGAFDITIAPLVRCWGFMEGVGRVPTAQALAEARANVGMHLVELDPAAFTVRFAREGVMLDLGAVGKGYAIDRAAELLREAGVTSALIHGGTSTIYALGRPPEGEGWKVAIQRPEHGGHTQPGSPGVIIKIHSGTAESSSEPPLAVVSLRDESLSVSAIRGKYFEIEGRTYGHILDPRTGQPANAAVLAAVVLPSATETDALSTALLTVGPEGHDRLASLRPDMRTLVVADRRGRLLARSKGIASGSTETGDV